MQRAIMKKVSDIFALTMSSVINRGIFEHENWKIAVSYANLAR